MRAPASDEPRPDDGDTFPPTQELLAEMLGVRRSTVTLIDCALQRAGLIQDHRGAITVLDRRGLEAAACECYRLSVTATKIRRRAPLPDGPSPSAGTARLAPLRSAPQPEPATSGVPRSTPGRPKRTSIVNRMPDLAQSTGPADGALEVGDRERAGLDRPLLI